MALACRKGGGLARRVARSAPGPDGLPYRLWGGATIAERYLDDSGVRLAAGGDLPGAMLGSLSLFIPKGEFREDTERAERRVSALRPLALMNTSSKLAALVEGEPLARIAAKIVHQARRGCIAGRELGDNILEVEGSLVVLSIAADSWLAAILLGFVQACQSLALQRRWLVLERLDICLELHVVVKGLCSDLRASVYDQGCVVEAFVFGSCIKQGGPLSGRLWIGDGSSDPVELGVRTLSSARRGLFADDVALVVFHIGLVIAAVSALLTLWRRASGLTLNPSKCAVVTGKPSA